MTVAVVSLAVALAAGIAAIAWLARKLESALHGQVDANRLFTDEKRVAEEYLAQRDTKEVRISELASLNTALKQRITALEIARNDAYDQAVKDIGERIRSAGIADGAAVIDRLLWAPLPGVSKAAPTGANRASGDDQGAMRPADVAATDSTERQDPG